MGHFLVDVFVVWSFFFLPQVKEEKCLVFFLFFMLDSSNLSLEKLPFLVLFFSFFHRRPATDVKEVKGDPGLCELLPSKKKTKNKWRRGKVRWVRMQSKINTGTAFWCESDFSLKSCEEKKKSNYVHENI